MTKRIYLHIGAPKTGTTYLQAVLAQSREALQNKGILYPEAIADAHHTAAWDLRGTPRQRKDAAGVEGAWQRLVTTVNDWTGESVIVSSEMFVYCDAKEIARVVEALDGEVHVVYTARDLVRQVPAVYQERIKNQQTLTYRDFVSGVVGHDGRRSAQHGFWRAQDAAEVLELWVNELDRSRIHIVTAPPASAPRSLLLDRFAEALGLSSSELAAEATAQANESLGVVQTELLRRYNERYGSEMPWPLYRRTIRLRLGDVFGAVDDPRRLTVPAADRRWLERRCAALVELLTRAQYDVIGDLADLIPVDGDTIEAEPIDDDDLFEPAEAEVLNASIDALHASLTAQEAERRAAKAARRRSGDRRNRNA